MRRRRLLLLLLHSVCEDGRGGAEELFANSRIEAVRAAHDRAMSMAQPSVVVAQSLPTAVQ